jgi:hypothetical protein
MYISAIPTARYIHIYTRAKPRNVKAASKSQLQHTIASSLFFILDYVTGEPLEIDSLSLALGVFISYSSLTKIATGSRLSPQILSQIPLES